MRNKKNNSSLVLMLFMLLIIGAGAFVFFSSMFERNAPTITMQTNGFWNFKSSLKIKIEDDSGIKSYKITLKTKSTLKTLQYERLITPDKLLNLEVEPPRGSYAMQDKDIDIIVEANDISRWDFLNGNSARKVFKLKIDKQRPKINIIDNSYKISRGGSALVVFSVEDKNLDKFYIQSNNKNRFYPQPFYKNGYFISLLAWPVQNDNFKATVVATDKAGNITKSYIPLYLKNRKYRVSRMNITDKFLKGKIASLSEVFEETQGIDAPLEQFKIINEEVRAKNEAYIHKLSSVVKNEKIDNFYINKMYPLKNAKVVAYFGDHRKYFYKGKYISQSYHLGLDLASNAMAKIKPQNGGEVVSSAFNGLYGNMPMISHGLGLYTIYGHCSTIKVENGDIITKQEVIANTGKTGYAMGDHLHFGVLVQGIEVRPQEWMDRQWIKLNITDIMNEAKKIIDRN